MTLFGNLCRALWGEGWADPAAAALGINRRTLQRWASGQNEMPRWALDKLREIAPQVEAERRRRIDGLLREDR